MFDQVQGDWPTHSRFILCSCDDKYFERYFPRFHSTFTKHWSLPIHAHIIDPSDLSLSRLHRLGVSHTYCDTGRYGWHARALSLQAFKPQSTIEWLRQILYETYCQAQRFILLGHRITKEQSVIVADVDAFAQHTPTDRQVQHISNDMAFTTFNGRLMATFCHFHPRRVEQCRTVAEMMKEMVMDGQTFGVDQKVLKSVFGTLPYTELTNGEWIRHFDVKTENDRKEHERCLIYHEKGTRGKNKPVETTWTDIGL